MNIPLFFMLLRVLYIGVKT